MNVSGIILILRIWALSGQDDMSLYLYKSGESLLQRIIPLRRGAKNVVLTNKIIYMVILKQFIQVVPSSNSILLFARTILYSITMFASPISSLNKENTPFSSDWERVSGNETIKLLWEESGNETIKIDIIVPYNHSPIVVLSPPLSPMRGSDEGSNFKAILESVCDTDKIDKEAISRLCKHVKADPQEESVSG